MNDPIVTLEVVAVFDQGHEVGLTARIGRAAPDADGWVCAVELAPVYQQPMNVKGVDSFHATWLACSLVLKLLGALRAEGAALRDREGNEFPLEAYVAGLDGKPRDAQGG
jgi:hypothetical protein